MLQESTRNKISIFCQVPVSWTHYFQMASSFPHSTLVISVTPEPERQQELPSDVSMTCAVVVVAFGDVGVTAVRPACRVTVASCVNHISRTHQQASFPNDRTRHRGKTREL